MLNEELSMNERPRFLSKEEIFGSPLREDIVEVPAWGGKVLVRELTKYQQDWCRQEKDFDSAVFLTGLVEPVFTREEVELLRGKQAEAFDRIVSAILSIGKPEA
jgi:hypothetical protein